MKSTKVRIGAAVLVFILASSNALPAFAGFGGSEEKMVEETIFWENTLPDIEGDSTEDDELTYSSTSSNAQRASASNARATQFSQFTIEKESDIENIFPDKTFRKAVFKAVEGSGGADVYDALASYRGGINAGGKKLDKKDKIKSIEGIQYLKNAGIEDTLDLSYNEIRNWTPAWSDPLNYGSLSENCVWEIKGNPIELLPATFGSYLVINQPASASYTYDDIAQRLSYIRTESEKTFEGVMDIGRSRIVSDDGSQRAAKVDSVRAVPGTWSTSLMAAEMMSNTQAKLTNIVKGGVQLVAVGIDQEIHYDTEDEFGTLTPGSQSYKYYLKCEVKVYDKVVVESGPYKGSIVIQKVDEEDSSKKLPGAVYELRKDGQVLGKYTTNPQGQITVMGLDEGEYTFVEITPPKGYLLDSTPVPFTIQHHETTISGGLDKAETNGQVIQASANERFIAGPKSTGCPDIILTRSSNVGKALVTVTYSSLGAAPPMNAGDALNPGEKVSREFYSVIDAQNDINKMKEANKITGPVYVKVDYEKVSSVSDIEPVVVKNKRDPNEGKITEVTTLSGKKVWKDEPGYIGFHPDIRIVLYQNNVRYQEMVLHDGQETFEFYNLPVYNESNTIMHKYTVEEEFADQAEAEKFYVEQSGNTITNTYIKGVKDIEGIKGWDNNGEEVLEHPDVTIVLKRNGREIDRYTISPDERAYAFRGLLLRDEYGRDYNYTVEEIGVDDYVSEKVNDYDFLNTHTPGHVPPPPSNGDDNGGNNGGGGRPGGSSPGSPGGPGDVVKESEEPKEAETSHLPQEVVPTVIQEEEEAIETLPKTGDTGMNGWLLNMMKIVIFGSLSAGIMLVLSEILEKYRRKL